MIGTLIPWWIVAGVPILIAGVALLRKPGK